MPLLLRVFLEPEGEIGVWKTTESSLKLMEELALTKDEDLEIERMTVRRQKEWISARFLIHFLSGRKKRAICLKDKYGKPYLADSDYKISVSHSQDHTAVIASPYQVGIDIQEIVPKMERISVKFVSEKEWNHVPEDSRRLEYLHVIWGAKEAMYKAWGKKEVDFKKHLEVEAFDWKNGQSEFYSSFKKANIQMDFYVTAKRVGQFILVYVQEKSRYVC